jgi:hypothetical protein
MATAEGALAVSLLDNMFAPYAKYRKVLDELDVFNMIGKW